MSPEHFHTFARYNTWANGHLYAACAALPDAEYRASRQAFFGSIPGTLNHILVADRIWLERLRGTPPDGTKLDQILFEDLAELTAARVALDRDILEMAESHDADSLGHDVVYRNSTGTEFRTPVAWVLSHMFNHQTHHRGQVHGLLCQTRVPPPSLDLIYFLRERATT
jgi:uncharacterized damage-inducible protein DinB